MNIWELDGKNDNIKPAEILACRACPFKKVPNVGCENGGKRASAEEMTAPWTTAS